MSARHGECERKSAVHTPVCAYGAAHFEAVFNAVSRRLRIFQQAARTVPLSACALWLLAACDPAVTVPEQAATLQDGPWQAIISSPGGDIETSFELGLDDGYQASLVNGQERFRIEQVSFDDGELRLRFPVFNSEIRANLSDGRLLGELTLTKQFGETQVMPFRADYGTEHLHEIANDSAKIDMSGRWAAQFQTEDGSSAPSIGEFAQRGSRLFGTFINIDGDHRYLAGHVDGNRFRLSSFDGAHAFLFTGTVDGDTIVDGEFWSGTSWYQTWSAMRDRDATLPDAFDRTRLKSGEDRLAFEFPDHQGNIVTLADEKYQGKVVIVTLGGSWCPNCNDEARFLTELHGKYGADGLEIVSLMFEHFDDQLIASEQVKLFRAKHSIQYDTLLAGISDKAYAAQQLPALETVLAFPTTIFIDRGARVRTIHTGFRGPGTGEHHDTLKSRFSALVAELLLEPVEPAEPEAAAAEPTGPAL